MLVLACKLLIALAFFGYARQAASVLPFFYAFVAVGADAMLIAPLLRQFPPMARIGRRIVAAAAVVVVGASIVASAQGWTYRVSGRVDAHPEWGPGAFESSQLLHIRRTPA